MACPHTHDLGVENVADAFGVRRCGDQLHALADERVYLGLRKAVFERKETHGPSFLGGSQ